MDQKPSYWLLRLRFWRSPPNAILPGSLVKYVIATCDEQGNEICTSIGTICNAVKYDNDEIVLIDDSKKTAESRWTVSFRAAEKGKWKFLEIAVSLPQYDSLDLINVSTERIPAATTSTQAPLLRCVRDFQIDPQHRLKIIEEFGATTGAHVWNGGVCLASYLCTLPLADISVLEIGAGCGLTSLAAAALGATVLSTDHPRALSLLEENCGSSCQIAGFDFSLASFCTRISTHRPALAVAADVLYAPSAPRHLAATLRQLASLSTFIIAHTERPHLTKEEDRFAQLQTALLSDDGDFTHFVSFNLCTRISPRFGNSVAIYRFDRNRDSGGLGS